MQTDPIGYKDGMNWYAYVNNDPINLIDSTGEAAHAVARCGFKRICRIAASAGLGFSAGWLANASLQQADDQPFNHVDALVAGSAGAVVSAVTAAKPSILKDPKQLAALGGAVAAATEVAANEMSGEDYDAIDVVLATAAGAGSTLAGTKLADSLGEIAGLNKSVVAEEIAGAVFGEAVAVSSGRLYDAVTDMPLYPNDGSTKLYTDAAPKPEDYIFSRPTGNCANPFSNIGCRDRYW